jgi:hypothetical protein
MPWKRVLIVWSLIVSCETVLGLLRQLILEPRIGLLAANHVGVFILLGLVLLVCLATSRWLGPRSKLGWMLLGTVWALLTVAFDAVLGRVMGLSWERLFTDYDPARGGLRILELIGLIYAPRFAAALRGTLA